jgi:hypothetical protein
VNGDGSDGGPEGIVRRVDTRATPDRPPNSLAGPDGRLPRPRRVEDPATPDTQVRRGRLEQPRGEVVDPHSTSDAPWAPHRLVLPVFDDLEPPANEPGGQWDVGDGRPRPARRERQDVVEANARLTGMTAAVLFVLLAIEGLTILRVRALLNVHVFVGMLLVPPVLLKIASTTWRFARYYLGDPAYRRKGPPPLLLRMLGPVVIVLTVTVLASGVALLLAPVSLRAGLLLVHKASFIVWLAAMAVHVLGHLLDTARLAPRDWARRTRRQVRGATARQWVVASTIGAGLVLGAVMLPKVAPWLAGGSHG